MGRRRAFAIRFLVMHKQTIA